VFQGWRIGRWLRSWTELVCLAKVLDRPCYPGLAAPAPAGAMGDRSAATVVLVHGSWHGAWCWDRVVPLLAPHGLRVATIDLPSCGRDAAGLADLEGDIRAVRLLLKRLEGPVIVCAHSYGGAPVTAAASGQGKVRRLIYLSAFMLDVGESCSTTVGGSLPSWCIARDDGTFIIDPCAAPGILYGDCDPRICKLAVSRLVPQLTVTSAQTVGAAAWRTIPSTYVVCTLDRAIPPTVQRRLAGRAIQTLELASSHSPFLSMPGAVASLIAECAA
jgi:pimeloyl-ACP methyl ester carboxylesterase